MNSVHKRPARDPAVLDLARAAANGAGWAERAVGEAERQIGRYPVASIALALAAGVLLGWLTVPWIRRIGR
jgi:hypothetical protein